MALIPLKNQFKVFIKKILSKFNLRIYSTKESYLTYVEIEKIGSIFELQPFLFEKNVLLKNTPLDKLRALPFLKWGSDTNHPFALAVKDALMVNNDQRVLLIHQTLDRFYKKVTPKYLEEITEINTPLKSPAWAIIMPWETCSLSQWTDMIKRSVNFENNFYAKNVSIAEGWSWLGPVSELKLQIEVKRLHNTMQSILNKGYQRSDESDGDIYGDLLVDKNDNWVIQTVRGQHRMAVLSGLSFDKVDIRIKSIVSVNHVKHWPQVKNGVYTEKQALNIFDNVFTGNSPSIYKIWESSI